MEEEKRDIKELQHISQSLFCKLGNFNSSWRYRRTDTISWWKDNPLNGKDGKLQKSAAQKSVSGKSNEIPTVEQLFEELEIKGCVVVADALNCQKKTAKTIIKGKADYLLCVKDNHKTLKQDVEEYIKDEE